MYHKDACYDPDEGRIEHRWGTDGVCVHTACGGWTPHFRMTCASCGRDDCGLVMTPEDETNVAEWEAAGGVAAWAERDSGWSV